MLFGWSGRLKTTGATGVRLPRILKGMPFRPLLVWYMRALSLLWLAKGLAGWALILGVLGGPPPFLEQSLAAQTATVFFALVDVIAGVGLWMLAGWGGVIWLISMASQMAIGLFVPRAMALSGTTMAVYIGLAAAFFLLSWMVIQQAEE